MKENYVNISAVILLLLLNTGAITFAQNDKTRHSNCSVCDNFTDSKPVIKKSTIAAWFDGPDVHLNYDVDLFIQDMDIFDEMDIPRWKNYVDDTHKQGKLIYAEFRALTHLGKIFEYLMDDPGMQQAVCVDVNLNSIKTPWMIERGYKDTPVRLFCGNHPRFRAYLRHQIYLMSQVGVDGIMVDDFTGSPMSYGLGGCFCEYCMAGFREYLKEGYNATELKALGINDINTFNYREIVLKHADDLNSMKMARNAGVIPLDREFRLFLYKSDADFFASLKEMACRLSGRYIEMGWDNVNFQPSRGIYYDFLDSYYSEIGYQHMGLKSVFTVRPTSTSAADLNTLKNQKEDEYFPPEMIYLYKFSDGTNKWFTPTPSPYSWAAIKIKNMTGLLRLWISFSYANGAHLRYPTKGWCYGPTSRWYYPPKEDFEPVYAFIRNNRDLFDNYEAVEQIGVLYSHSSSTRPIKYVGGELVNMNVPFGTPVAGDDWLINRIHEEDIDRYELMLIPEPYEISKPQQQIIENWKKKKPVISVKEGDDLEKILEGKIDPLLSLDSESKVWLFPRHNPENKKAPLICHLINHDYDAERNQNNLQRNVQIRLSKKLLEGSAVRNITYHTLDRGSVKADYSVKGNDIHVTIPEINLWGVLKVEKR